MWCQMSKIIFTYSRTSSRNDAQYGLSLMSNENGHIGFKYRKLRKTEAHGILEHRWLDRLVFKAGGYKNEVN